MTPQRRMQHAQESAARNRTSLPGRRPLSIRIGNVPLIVSLLLAVAALGLASASANPTPAGPRPQNPELAFSANPTPEEIFRARVFQEPLIPVGGEPTAEEDASLAAALVQYSERNSPDDFGSLTAFLNTHPQSPWNAALLTGLGLEYYNTAHYSLALSAWQQAWELAQSATARPQKALADRAAGELAYLFARLGRSEQLQALLDSVQGRVFVGPGAEKISGAKEGLWNMKNRPDISFRCGPLALHRIKALTGASYSADRVIYNSASRRQGFSLPQVEQLSHQIGLNYQMAFRPRPEHAGSSKPSAGPQFVVPSVVHWKLGHYAAMVRREGERYLIQDPTFGNDVWATPEALDEEASGYFLIPPGPLPKGWRAVSVAEGGTVWGKGVTANNDPKPFGCKDPRSGGSKPCSQQPNQCKGMAQSSVHLMLVSLHLEDEPVGYSPPVGPAVEFTVRYNHRDSFQPANFTYSNFGPKWTCDWIAYITDNPQSPLADVNYYMRGGGVRTFTGFDTNTQSYAFQQMDQTRLTRTGPASYELVFPDGSKEVFSQSDGSAGTSRKIFLTQDVGPHGNAASLHYDGNLRLVSITDAIGQVTRLTYGLTNDIYKITRVTDPFGRFAQFDYDASARLTNITDVIGLNSTFGYETNSDFINTLITPYGTNTFTRGESGTTRWLETTYADGSRDRVEYNQSSNLGVPDSEPATTVPQGMATNDRYLYGRNTFYWSRNAFASAHGDYTKARIYHWLHTPDITTTSGILESTKEPLERRVWYDYAGQSAPYYVGSTDRPFHVGRVLDDGSTQLYTYQYNGFGKLTNSVDPVGRTFSYLYATNGIDLLEIRQTRGENNELLVRMTYNAQHEPLTSTDAAGQTTRYTYNARGQLLTEANPKNETITCAYDPNGYLIVVDGPLPGTNDSTRFTYDVLGRVLTKTDVGGYTLTFAYDALNRVIGISHPDGTSERLTYDRLDPVLIQDRAGRRTVLEYDALGELKRRVDPLGRVTLFQWCQCGDMKSLTDPMGRTTTWRMDIQSRLITKQYGDGTQVNYLYEPASGRLRQIIDEKAQLRQFTYNRDNTLAGVAYLNTAVATPAISYAYDANYQRRVSMTDGTGTTLYSYYPVSPAPSLGAGQLASVAGPLPNDTITYEYDALGRRVATAINGVASRISFDAAGRVVNETNALGSFSKSYDGGSLRLLSESFPNGLVSARGYGNDLRDFALEEITHQVGPALVSEFRYGRDTPTGRIITWSQQAGAQAPDVYTLGYDAADQVLSASVTNSGVLMNAFGYSYDLNGNRLSEQAGGLLVKANYNGLNELSGRSGGALNSRTNEWDAQDQLVAVDQGNRRTELTYDGLGRLAGIRLLTNGVQASEREFVWSDNDIVEERDASGALTKRFFRQGVQIETGPGAGAYFYTRDHLGSIRDLIDGSGNIRAHYSYDPYGRRTKITGDVDADFGFTGLFWSSEAGLLVARYRAYDPELGRWLSRDPLPRAEVSQGENLYAYVHNNPISLTDPLGLCCEEQEWELESPNLVPPPNLYSSPYLGPQFLADRLIALMKCLQKPCRPCAPTPPPADTDCDQRGICMSSVGKPAERMAFDTEFTARVHP